MSLTVSVRLRDRSSDALLGAMSALAPDAWAFELVGNGHDEQLFVLMPDHDGPSACDHVMVRLTAAGITFASVDVLAKTPSTWVGWREASGLLQVGPVWIVPRGKRRPPAATRVVEIDAGHAFGSGLHPTTRMMLARVLELSPMGPVLDVGAGSGILALTALALGAPRAVAVEIDPPSVAAAAENARRSGLAARFEVSSRTLSSIPDRFPIVLANIIARVLVDLAPELARRVAPSGRLVLSGLRPPDLSLVAPVFTGLGLTRGPIVEHDGWLRFELVAPCTAGHSGEA